MEVRAIGLAISSCLLAGSGASGQAQTAAGAQPGAALAGNSATSAASPTTSGTRIGTICSGISSKLSGDAKEFLQAACPHVAEGIDAANDYGRALPLPVISYAGDSTQFNQQLSRSLRTYVPTRSDVAHHRRRPHVVDDSVTVELTTPVTGAQLSGGNGGSNLQGTNLGVWLNEIKQSGGTVAERDTNQGAVPALPALAIEYGLKPLVTALLQAFGRNPYGPARYSDAVLVTPLIGENANKVVRICFVARGTGASATCPAPSITTMTSGPTATARDQPRR